MVDFSPFPVVFESIVGQKRLIFVKFQAAYEYYQPKSFNQTEKKRNRILYEKLALRSDKLSIMRKFRLVTSMAPAAQCSSSKFTWFITPVKQSKKLGFFNGPPQKVFLFPILAKSEPLLTFVGKLVNNKRSSSLFFKVLFFSRGSGCNKRHFYGSREREREEDREEWASLLFFGLGLGLK